MLLDLRTPSLILILIVFLATYSRSILTAGEPTLYQSEQIFQPVPIQTHAPGIVELENGDLLASWYGDTKDSDTAVFGARKSKNAARWGKPFVMADRLGFPDGNTCMMIDSKKQLWLFWPTVIGSSWESCLMNFRVSTNYLGSESPIWNREGVILLKPDNFADEALALLGDQQIQPPRGAIGGPEQQRAKLSDPLFQRLGWAPRCKPTILPSGRILLPLYTDTFSISIMAISDDGGDHWFASKPIIGWGNIQPTVLRKNDGTLIAYMRENGNRGRIRTAESFDEGMHWNKVQDSELPNPGSGIDGLRLSNGHWVMVYNDSATSRSSLVISLSEDEGKTWSHTADLERHLAGRYHYPAVTEGADGTIHVIYSCFIAGDETEGERSKAVVLKGIKHVALNEKWILEGGRGTVGK